MVDGMAAFWGRCALLVAAVGGGLAACEHGGADEWRVYRLANGGYEAAMPLSPGNMGLPEGVTLASLNALANNLCAGRGYELREVGMRKAPQYSDPERVWLVACKE